MLGDVTTVNLTGVEGGVQHNVVPDEFKAKFDIRVSPKTDMEVNGVYFWGFSSLTRNFKYFPIPQDFCHILDHRNTGDFNTKGLFFFKIKVLQMTLANFAMSQQKVV